MGSLKEINAQQGSRIGAVFCLQVVAQRLGLAQALGTQRPGKLALWQVFARLSELAEVVIDNIRYILRRNPQRVSELADSRQNKLSALKLRLSDKQRYLDEHPRAHPEIARNRLADYTKLLKIDQWAKVTLSERTLGLSIDQAAWTHETQLDGCYVIKSDVPGETATAAAIHQRYKDLAQVERAFRTFKSGHLEIRPTFVQTEASTRGHVFVVMLAYLLERELAHYWRHLDLTVSEALDELGSVRGIELAIANVKCQKVPQPTGLNRELLAAAQVKLPDTLPLRKTHVATRKKLSIS